MRVRTIATGTAQSSLHGAPGETSGVARLSASELEAWLARQQEFALVLFDTPWSAACRLELEVLGRLVSHFEGRVRLGAVDAAASLDAAHRFGVSWVPTIVLFAARREVARWEGARAPADLTIEIQGALARADAMHALDQRTASGRGRAPDRSATALEQATSPSRTRRRGTR
jgi:thioredoxin-like negative regulator of GroEL